MKNYLQSLREDRVGIAFVVIVVALYAFALVHPSSAAPSIHDDIKLTLGGVEKTLQAQQKTLEENAAKITAQGEQIIGKSVEIKKLQEHDKGVVKDLNEANIKISDLTLVVNKAQERGDFWRQWALIFGGIVLAEILLVAAKLYFKFSLFGL